MTMITEPATMSRPATFDHEPAAVLAAREYELCGVLLARLSADEWEALTANDGWSVRDTAGHMLGMMQLVASLPQLIGQTGSSLRAAKRAGDVVAIDHLTDLQVRRNAHLKPAELIAEWRRLTPKAVRGRHRIPGLVRRRTLPEAQLVGDRLEKWTIGYLTDVILTRDPFMHRLDICAATNHNPAPTREHDGVLVDDVAREWLGRHGQPCRLTLSGPAGGEWGSEGEVVALDALDFCRILSGRGVGVGLLATAVPF